MTQRTRKAFRPIATGAVLCLVVLLAPAAARADDDSGDSIPVLLRQLEHGSMGEQDHAIERLDFLGVDVTGPVLRILLASQDPDERLAAVRALDVIHDPAARGGLERLVLVDPDWEVRRDAVDALGGLRSRHSLFLIEQTLHRDRNARVRKSCVSALAAIGGGEQALAEAGLHDEDLEVRLRALTALGRGKSASAARRVRPLLADGSLSIRYAAAQCLAWHDDPVAKRFLTEAIRSTDSEARQRAVQALASVPHPWATELLVQTFTAGDEQLACAAAVALAKQKDPRGAQYLVKLATSGGPEAKEAERWLDSLSIPIGAGDAP